MDASISVFQELALQEHSCAVAFHTNPDQHEFWESMSPIKELVVPPWFPDGFSGREFGFFGKGELPEGLTPRVLLAVESYESLQHGTVYVGYFGDTKTTLDAHLSLTIRRFAAGDPLLVFGEERQCVDCRGAGRILDQAGDGAATLMCPFCHGRGWKFYGGKGEAPELRERIGSRALVRMTNALDQDAWHRMFPDGDGLGD